MVKQPELREALLVWGRAPSQACPERSRRVHAERSSATSRGHSISGFAISGVLASALFLLLSNAASWAQSLPPQLPAESPSKSEAQSGATSGAKSATNFGTITPYLGLTIDRIELPGVPPEDVATLLSATPLKTGEPLTREALHDAMQALFATGRFADIQAEADRTETGGVSLRFLTTANFFVGMLTIEGVTTNPSPNQLASATRLQLGELYAREKIDRALAGIQRVMEENGFPQSRVTISEDRDQPQHQVNMTFHVVTGPRAVVGEIKLEGDAGYPVDEIREIAKLHTGDPVVSSRITRALQRIRARYQKQDRLLAQVSIATRTYRPELNTVDYVFKVDRGPVVAISAQGFKLSQRKLRKLVPIYEEGAVDDDLLNEGRRNITNHLQTLGYFKASASGSPQTSPDGKNLQVVYVVNPGARHKLASIRISGNRYFDEDLIRSRMQNQSAGRLFSHGRYSEVFLEEDVRSIQALYRASGFRQAEVTSKLVEKYQGDPSQLAIEIVIKGGLQTPGDGAR